MSNQALKNQTETDSEEIPDLAEEQGAGQIGQPENLTEPEEQLETGQHRETDAPATTAAEAPDEAMAGTGAHQKPARPSYLDDIEITPPPEDGSGLIDPERPSSSALIHEKDLAIARNLRRLEIHRYEIAAALETLKSEELEGLVDEEDEIMLAEAEEKFLAHQQERRRTTGKRKNRSPDQILDEALSGLKSGIRQKARQLIAGKDIRNIEFMGHNFCHTWHRLRFDQTVEERLFRPEADCPARLIETDEQPLEPADEDQTDKASATPLEAITVDLEGEDTAPQAGEDPSEATPSNQPLTNEAPSDELEAAENQPAPLCAPVRLLNWSLDQLAAYQPEQSFRHFAFLDPDAGHGRTLLVAAERDFRAIWGFQPQANLAEATSMNIRQYPRSFMTQRTIDLYRDQPNISQWADYPMLVHLFKPASATWLTNLRDALHTSFNENPRQIYLVAIGNEHKAILDEAPFLTPFSPPVGNLEMFTLFSPYEIEFYHSTVVAE